MICLDTNVAIVVMNKTSPSAMARFTAETRREDIFLPVIALFELRFGVEASARHQENARRLQAFLKFPLKILPFEPSDAEHAADIRADLKRKGTPIGAYDVLIAAQARRHGATLVTNNTREFSRVKGLTLDDWT